MDVAQHPIHRCYQEWQETGTAPCDPVVALRENQPEGREHIYYFISEFGLRDALIPHWGFCFPRPALIDYLLAKGPVLELGAGKGLVSKLVMAAGGDIVATDIAPSAHHVLELDAETAVKQDQGKSLIFCSWPSLAGDWFGDALQFMRPGQKVVFIGEPGSTASHTFFDQVGRTLIPERLENSEDFNVRFRGLNDRAHLLRRVE